MHKYFRQLVVYSFCVLILFAVSFITPPSNLEREGFIMMGIAFVAALLWFTEVIPIALTALLVVFLQSIMGILSLGQAIGFLAHPVNLLIFIGLTFSLCIVDLGLDKKITLEALKFAGSDVKKLLFMMMVLVAFLSMWMSNTATVAIMIPIATGIVKISRGQKANMGKLFTIGIAFAGTIGGMGTPVGTTPNPIAIGFLQDLAHIDLTFADWMVVGVPFVIILIPLAWKLLTVLYPLEIQEVDTTVIQEMEMSSSFTFNFRVKKFLVIFCIIVFLWLLDSFKTLITLPNNWLYLISLFGSIVLFFPGLGVLNWKQDINKISWSTLILIGGGMSLGSGLVESGLVEWILQILVPLIQDKPLLFVTMVVVLVTSMCTVVFCSITAVASTVVPIAIMIALHLELNPVIIAAAAGIASSFAFILPANTPPNAIAYESDLFKTKDMVRAGFLLMGLSILVFPLVYWLVWRWYF